MRRGPDLLDDDRTYFTMFRHKFAAICTDTIRIPPLPHFLMNYYALHNFRQLMTRPRFDEGIFGGRGGKKESTEAKRKKFCRLCLIYACLIYENLMYL